MRPIREMGGCRCVCRLRLIGSYVTHFGFLLGKMRVPKCGPNGLSFGDCAENHQSMYYGINILFTNIKGFLFTSDAPIMCLRAVFVEYVFILIKTKTNLNNCVPNDDHCEIPRVSFWL